MKTAKAVILLVMVAFLMSGSFCQSPTQSTQACPNNHLAVQLTSNPTDVKYVNNSASTCSNHSQCTWKIDIPGPSVGEFIIELKILTCSWQIPNLSTCDHENLTIYDAADNSSSCSALNSTTCDNETVFLTTGRTAYVTVCIDINPSYGECNISSLQAVKKPACSSTLATSSTSSITTTGTTQSTANTTQQSTAIDSKTDSDSPSKVPMIVGIVIGIVAVIAIVPISIAIVRSRERVAEILTGRRDKPSSGPPERYAPKFQQRAT